MADRIEWAEIGSTEVGDRVLTEAGEVRDCWGNSNEQLALSIGGVCLEGSAEEWLAFGVALAADAQRRIRSAGCLCEGADGVTGPKCPACLQVDRAARALDPVSFAPARNEAAAVRLEQRRWRARHRARIALNAARVIVPPVAEGGAQ